MIGQDDAMAFSRTNKRLRLCRHYGGEDGRDRGVRKIVGRLQDTVLPSGSIHDCKPVRCGILNVVVLFK